MFETYLESMSFPTVPEAVEIAVTELHALPKYENESLAGLKTLLNMHLFRLIEPSAVYFMSTIWEKLHTQVQLFKICRLCNPYHVKVTNPSILNVRAALEALDYFTPNEINLMMLEWERYQEACNEQNIDDFPDGSDPLATLLRGNPDYLQKTYESVMESCITFWKYYKSNFPHLSLFACYCMSMTTSSAGAERVFSVLKNSFGPQQQNSLEDYVSLSVLYQFNKRVIP